MRLLGLLVLATIVFYLGRIFLRRLQAPASSETSASNPAADKSVEPPAEAMLQCLHCGAYFPASEAIAEAPDRLFCSEEHRQQHHTPR